MRFIYLLLVGILGFFYVYIGDTSLTIDKNQLPPIVRFINPYDGFWANADPINPIGQSFHSIPELEANGDVYFDDNHIPHIYAESLKDAYRLQGYVHASQRLWQMDLISRAAAGKLAEVVGPSALNHDIYQRKIGMLYAAENALDGVSQHTETMSYVEAFCEGANAYIKKLQSRDYPVEYKLMGFKPRQWEPIDVMLLFKQMAYDLCFRHEDIASTITRQFMTPAVYDTLFSIEDYADPVISTQDTWLAREISNLSDSLIYKFDLNSIKGFFQPNIDENNGSNNWAISGKKTASGSPMLASDPHLGLSLPSIWYENHINTPDMNVYGVSVPGIPAILIGFNDYIAWGETNVGHDVADWRALEWIGNDFTTYSFDSSERSPIIRSEKIKVKNSETITVDLYLTEAGIVAYTEDKADPRYGKAFHWLAHDRNSADEFSTFINLNAAQDLSQYREALKPFATPAQNFAFASTEGDIAITVQGKFPVKPQGDGKYVQTITKSSQLHSSFIPDSQIPRQINPERNYIASANQISTSEDYPFFYNSPVFEHFRNRYLNSVLDTSMNMTITDFETMQLSNYSKEAEYALKVLIPFLEEADLNPEETILLDSLKAWNNEFNKNDSTPVLYSIFISNLMRHAWDEWEQENTGTYFRYPSIYNTIHLIDKNIPFSFMLNKIDGTSYKSIGALVNASFTAAVNQYKNKKEQDPELNWADYKGTVINHLAGIQAFSSGFLNTGGHHSALNAQKSQHGPSWRMVVSMSNPVEAYGVYPGGQSGNPGSIYYDNMMDDWVNGKYHELSMPKNPEDLKNKFMKWIFQEN